MRFPQSPDVVDGDGDPAALPPSGFELRLGDGRAFVSAAGRPLGEGIVARRFRMEVPHIKFPFDLTGGADRFRDQRCLLRELELSIDAAAVGRLIDAFVDLGGLSKGTLQVAARPGFIEVGGLHPLAGAFTAKIAVEVNREGTSSDGLLGFFLYDFRLYQPGSISAAELIHRFAANVRPPLERREPLAGGGVAADILTPALRQLLVARGFRLPDTRGVALRRAHVLSGQLVLEFEEQDLPASPPSPAELLAREGQRAFAEVETLIAQGELAKAREALRDLSQVESHPFAAERFLQLLVNDPSSHDLALDLCALLRRRSPAPSVALWVEGVIRETNEEWEPAARCFLELAELSLSERGLFAASLAARRAAELALHGHDDALANRAYALWESAVPNDVDALLGVAQIAERRKDLPTALSALRRVSAFATDGRVAASAHARLGKLLLATSDDVARARLHLDQALRYDPDDLSSVLALAESCERTGEYVRTVRLLDRGARLARTTGDKVLAIGLLRRSGAIWQERFGRPENALLRLREALGLEPAEAVRGPLLAAVVALTRDLGLRQDALEAQRAVTRASAPGRPRAEALLLESRLLAEDPIMQSAADEAIQRALEESPSYLDAAREWVRLRRGSTPAALRVALTTAANLAEPEERAELLVERGELETDHPELGESPRATFAEALSAAPEHHEALRLLAGAAELEGDVAAACAAWLKLAELSGDSEQRATLLRRLADVAARLPDSPAVTRTLRAAAESPEAPLPILLRLLDVERRRGDAEAEADLALRISRLADSNEESAIALSVLIEQLDRVDTAEEVQRVRPLLSRAVELAPQDGQVRATAVRLFRLDGDLESLRPALEAYLQTAEAQPITRQLQIWRELAEVSLAIGLRREAIAAYEAIQVLDAEDRDAADALVDLYSLEGDTQAQTRSLRTLAELLLRHGDTPAAAAKLIQLAELQADEQPEAALDHLRRALVMDRGPRTLRALANLAEQLGHRPLAVETLAELGGLEHETLEPADRAAAYRRAAELVSDADASLEFARRAVEVEPRAPWARLFTSLEALRAGHAALALEAAHDVLAADSAELDVEPALPALAHAVVAAAARETGDAHLEETALRELSERDPDELSYVERRFDLLSQIGGDLQELRQLLERIAPRLSSERAAAAYSEIAQRLREQGDLDAATQAYHEALVREPGHPLAVVELLRLSSPEDPERKSLRARALTLPGEGGLLSTEERGTLLLEEAQTLSRDPGPERERLELLLEEATALRPTDPAPLAALAELFEEDGKLAEAAEARSQLARRLSGPEAAEVLVASADLHQRAGQPQVAADTLARALTLGLPKELAGETWLRLASLRAELGAADGERQALDEAVGMVAPARRGDIHQRRGDLFLQAGDREAERTALTQAFLAGNQGTAVLQRLRAASEALGDHEGVADALERLIHAQAAEPEVAAATAFELAQLAKDQLGKLPRAEAAYRRVLAFTPRHFAARAQLADLLIQKGDAESVGRGLDLLAEGLPLLPDAERTQAAVALAERAAADLGRADVGLRLLRERVDRSDLPVNGVILGAKLLYRAGATNEALVWIERGFERAEMGPEDRELLGLYRAELLGDLGRDPEAFEVLLSTLATPPFPATAIDQLILLLGRGTAKLPRERLDALVNGLRQHGRAAQLLTADARARLTDEPQLAAEDLRRALQLEDSEARRGLLREALAAAGDSRGLLALLEQDAVEEMARGGASARPAWEAVAEAARTAGDIAAEERALVALSEQSDAGEVGAVLLRLGELRVQAGDSPAGLRAYLDAARRGEALATERAEALARLLGDARALAELLELRLSHALDADRTVIFGELAELYRGPLQSPEQAERVLRRSLTEGLAPASSFEALIEILQKEGRRREIAELIATKGRQTADAATGALLLDRAAAEFRSIGDESIALGLLREAVAVERLPARLLALADALHDAGLLAEARALDAELCEREELPPFSVLERRAQWLREVGDARALAEFLETFAGASQQTAGWLLEAAGARQSLDDPEGELRDLRAAFDADPGKPETFARLVARGTISDAKVWADLLQRRAAAVPSEAGTLLRSAGEILFGEGHLAAAADLYEQALGQAPNEPLALVGRVEVALAQGSAFDLWLGPLRELLREGALPETVAGEALSRTLEALVDNRAYAEAREVLAAAAALPESARESHFVLALRDRLAEALGDHAEQVAVRRTTLTKASGEERGAALQSLLEITRPEDPEALAVFREAFDLEGSPHSVIAAERLQAALGLAGDAEPLAVFIEGLLDLDLLPTPTAAERSTWARQAAELRWQRLGQQEEGRRLYERALEAAGDSESLLQALAGDGVPTDIRVLALMRLSDRATPEVRAELLYKRAELSEQLSPDAAATAWQEVLRAGPGGPGYLAALERALSEAIEGGRHAETAALFIAKAEALEGGTARAQLFERAAQIKESKLDDVEGALDLYRRAAAESGDVRWFTLLAEAYDRAGRTAEAAAALAVEVARREPSERRTERERKLGLMLAHDLARPADALPYLRAVAEASAVDDEGVLEALAESAAAVGDPELELKALARLAGSGRGEPLERALRRAEILQALGRGAEAGELLSALARGEPGNSQIFAILAALLRDRKAWRELGDLMAAYAAAATELEPEARLRLTRDRAQVARDVGDSAEAERLFREVLALAPRDLEALGALRQLVDARGDERELMQVLGEQLALSTEDNEIANLAFQLGEVEQRMGEPSAAREHLRTGLDAATRATPNATLRFLAKLSQVELSLGNAQTALELAEAALAQDPEGRLPLVQIAAQAALQRAERLRALGYLKEWLSLRPGDADAIAALETLSRDGAEPGAAMEALVAWVTHEAEPTRKARALRELAALREGAHDLMGTESALREAARLDPDSDEGFSRLRAHLESEGRFEELAQELRERARGTTDDVVRAAALAEQAELLRTQLHNPSGAAEAYQRSLEILPRASTSEGYAEALFALGQDDRAAEHYRRALSGGGHLGEFFLLYRLGSIAARGGDRGLALEQYQRSIDANPSFLPARESLIELAEELGKHDVAVAALRGMAAQLDGADFAEQLAEVQLRIAELEKRLLHFDGAAQALEKAAGLLPTDLRPLERLAALYQNSARWSDAVRVLERMAVLTEGADGAGPLTAAGELSLDKLADMERAAALFEKALALAPEKETALRRLLEIAASLGNRQRLLELAEPVLVRYPAGTPLEKLPAWLDELFVPLASALQEQGRLEEAHRLLGYARARAPQDLEVLSRQAQLAKTSGRFGEEADLEEEMINRITEQRPLEAATRMRALARRILELDGELARSRLLLEKAAELAPARPEDRRLLADLWRRSGDPALATEALGVYLTLVRRDPALDIVLLRTLEATAAELDQPELAQTVHGFLSCIEHQPAGTAPTLTPLPPEAWSLGGGEGGIDLALRRLAPYLEPLFPSQLERFGVGDIDRVGPGLAPELGQWIDRARESLGARPVEIYLAPTYNGVATENTHPPSLIVGAPMIQVLAQGGFQWLLCQRLALMELGLTLVAKFSPRDVATLVSLVALFLSDEAPVPEAERARLQAFVAALTRSTPEPVRQGLLEHGPRIARELQSFDPHRYVARAHAKASRLALLVTGDLRSALNVLDYLEPSEATRGRPWELPQGKALVDWAFSDEHLMLRRLSLGKPPR